MSTRREQILARLATRFAALETSARKFERNRDVPVVWGQLPDAVTSYLVLLDGIQERLGGTAGTTNYLATPVVEFYVRVPTPAAIPAAIDALYVAALGVVIAADADRLGNLVQAITEHEFTTNVTREAGGPSAECALTLAIQFATRSNDPTAGG